MFNYCRETAKKGDQVWYAYGHRSNEFLLENYNFSLTAADNKFATCKFRVIVGTSPEAAIEDPTELFAPKKLIEEDYENLELTTEVMVCVSNHLSSILFNYLRSVLTNNYKEMEGEYEDYLMISCPRVVKFELMMVDFAIKLLEAAYNTIYCKR